VSDESNMQTRPMSEHINVSLNEAADRVLGSSRRIASAPQTAISCAPVTMT
jgi:hypothetical protein